MSTKSSSSKTKKVSTTRYSTTPKTERSVVSQFTSKPDSILQNRLMSIKYKEITSPDITINDKKIMKHISDHVILDKTPHFAIVSLQKEGCRCAYLEEQQDGTFKKFIQSFSDVSLFKNMLEQLLISILTLHHFGLRKSNFNDIDLNEITYRKTNVSNTETYFHYKIFEKNYYIQDHGFLWIFSTLNEMENNKYNQPYITQQKYESEDEEDFEDEYSRLFEYLLQNKQIPEEMKEIINDLQELITESPIKTFDGEVSFFKKIFKSEILFDANPSKHTGHIANKGNAYRILKDEMTFSTS